MSLWRLVYYSAVIGGWAALLGWLPAELLFFRSNSDEGYLQVAATGALLGGTIGVGLSVVGGMANAQWKQLTLRALAGFAIGFVCGALAILLGKVLVSLSFPRAFGWLIMGLGIGIVDGVYERSTSKIRNGLIGGCVGGLVGGFLFDPLQKIIASDTGMSSRAIGFVILGLCIGALIGLAQVILKDAWLTVLDGYRTGRQLILSQTVTVLGRGDHLPLPFMGPMNKDLESEHLKIIRQPSGLYILEDNHTRLGTRLNNQQLTSSAALKDGDVIKFGTNFVRFNERHRRTGEVTSGAPQPGSSQPIVSAPPPPRIKKPQLSPPAKPIATQVSQPVGPLPPQTPEIKPMVPATQSAPTSAPKKPPLSVPPTPPRASPPSTAPQPSVVKRPAMPPPPPPRRKN